MARYRLCRICKRAAVKEENGICENCGAKVAPDVLREWNSQRSDDEQHTLRAERERHQQSLTYRPSPGLSTRARLWLFAIAILLAVVISLPKITDEFAWKTLEETPEAYETYLSRYPGSWHVKAAAAVLDDLRWKVARKSNDIRGYETYLAHGHSSDKPSYWRGAHDKEATARLDELLWKSAAESDQPEDYRRYVQELPEGAHLCMAHLQLAKWSPTRTDELEKAMALCDKSSDEYQRAARENRIRGARDDAAFAIAKGRGDVRSINAYIAQYARHVSEATELLSELRLREEAARLLVALLRLPPVTPLSRRGVKVVVVDSGEHGSMVREIIQSLFVGSIEDLDMHSGIYSILGRIAAEKANDPSVDLVVNMSWTHPDQTGPSPVEQLGFDRLRRAGVVFVAAAGNEGSWIRYPAAYQSVLAVGSVTSTYRLTDYTNRGGKLDFCAVDFTEARIHEFIQDLEKSLTAPECLAELQNAAQWNTKEAIQRAFDRFLEKKQRELTSQAGTSFAAPVISGALASALAQDHNVSIEAVIERLKSSAYSGGQSPCSIVEGERNWNPVSVSMRRRFLSFYSSCSELASQLERGGY